MKTSSFVLIGAALFSTIMLFSGPMSTSKLLQAGEELDRRRQLVLAQTVVLAGIKRDLIASRLTLAHAAERVRELDQHNAPSIIEQFRPISPGNSQEERTCRWLIRAVKTDLAADAPHLMAEIVGRLEAELEDCLNCCR